MSTPARKRPVPVAGTRPRPREQWEESAALYGIDNWGKGYFSVSEEGDLVVHPTGDANRGVVLKQIVDEVALRGITSPMIVRFPQILASAVANLNEAFAHAIEEYGYGNSRYLMESGDSLQFIGGVPHGPVSLLDLPIQFLSLKTITPSP